VLSETVENLSATFAGESQANRRYLAFARKADDECLPQIAKLFRAAAVYPEFLSDAKQDVNKQAAWSFDVTGRVEQVYANLFQKAFDALKGGKITQVDYYVCGVCGNTVENSVPERCPICGAVKSKFAKIA
jgi:rubrerythrin